MKPYAVGEPLILQHIARGKTLRQAMLHDGLGLGLASLGKGQIFYVDGNAGSNNNSGVIPTSPWKTIKHALTKCVAFRNDYILVLDHYQETFPIVVNVDSVHIIGIGGYNVAPYQPMVWLTASGDTTIFNIIADYFEIAGFEFGSGASYGAIEWTGSKGYGWIHDNAFGRMQTGLDGIQVPATFDPPQMLIGPNNVFGPGLTRDGIRVDHNMTRGIIEDNLFLSVPGIGINIPGSFALGTIRRNKFKLPSDTGGKAITLSATAGTGEGFVEDNDANFGATNAMGNIPWVVTGGAADTVTFDNNKRGGVVVFPA